MSYLSKGKSKFRPKTGHESARWGYVVNATARPIYPLYRRPGGPQDQSGRVRKIPSLPGLDPRTVQVVASRCTNYAIPTHTSNPYTVLDRTWGFQEADFPKFQVNRHMRALLDVSILEDKINVFFWNVESWMPTNTASYTRSTETSATQPRKTKVSYVVKISSNVLVHKRTFDKMEGADILIQSIAISRRSSKYTGQYNFSRPTSPHIPNNRHVTVKSLFPLVAWPDQEFRIL